MHQEYYNHSFYCSDHLGPRPQKQNLRFMSERGAGSKLQVVSHPNPRGTFLRPAEEEKTRTREKEEVTSFVS